MPKLVCDAAMDEFFLLDDTATKCLATDFSSNEAAVSQLIAVFALVMVSVVVKVLLETINNTFSGSSGRKISAICAPSTFET